MLNKTIISECWTGEDIEGNNRGLGLGNPKNFTGETVQNHKAIRQYSNLTSRYLKLVVPKKYQVG